MRFGEVWQPPQGRTLWVEVFTMLTLLALLVPAHASAGYIPVQGALTDSDGVPIDGAVDVTFRLATDPTGATSIWTDTLTVDVVQGRFAAELGTNLPLDLDTFASYPATYLGITVAGDSEMPLVPLDHVPYAAFAETSGDARTLDGMSLAGLRAEIPLTSDIESVAQQVCYDSPAELTAVLDTSYAYTAGTGLGLTDQQFTADQTTIDGWSQALVDAHATDGSAHHAPYTDSDADLRVGAHTAVTDAHHSRYSDGEADARIAIHDAISDAHHSRYTHGEADARIAVHDAISDAHHSRYTNGEADARIAVHEAVSDAHHSRYTNGETDARIAVHEAISDAHHSRYTDAEAFDVQPVVFHQNLSGRWLAANATGARSLSFANGRMQAATGAVTDEVVARVPLVGPVLDPSASYTVAIRVTGRTNGGDDDLAVGLLDGDATGEDLLAVRRLEQGTLDVVSLGDTSGTVFPGASTAINASAGGATPHSWEATYRLYPGTSTPTADVVGTSAGGQVTYGTRTNFHYNSGLDLVFVANEANEVYYVYGVTVTITRNDEV